MATPVSRLPYTTADMAERLAKKKAEQDAATNAQLAGSVLGPGITRDAQGNIYANGQKVDWSKPVAPTAVPSFNKGTVRPPAVEEDKGGGTGLWPSWGEIGNAIKTAYEWFPDEVPSVTPVNTPGGVVMGSQGTPKSLIVEPARLAVRRAVGDITAIPRVGEPSPSYTADQIREQGVARGVLGAAIDYSQFIPVVAKGAGVTDDLLNAYKIASIERAANPFPALRYADNVIDVAEGSRLPARVVESPTTPAMQLAESQTQRALPPAEIAPAIAETPASRLAPPAFRERPVSTKTRLTLQDNGSSNYIRAFDNETGEYLGVIMLEIDRAMNKVKVTGLSSKSPTLTTQLIAAAANEARKVLGDVPYPLTPSTNLSMYSRPFVERLQQAGLIDPDYQLPAIDSLNKIDRSHGPESFVSSLGHVPQEVIDPLSYQPTYNDVLKALVESKRQAKLEGKGRLSTPSKEVQTIKNTRNVPVTTPPIYNAITQRYRLYGLNMTEHPVLERLSNGELDQLVADINRLPGDGVTAIEKLIQDTDLSSIQNYVPSLPAAATADVFRISESVATYMWQQRLINRLTYERLRNQISNRYYNSLHDTNGL